MSDNSGRQRRRLSADEESALASLRSRIGTGIASQLDADSRLHSLLLNPTLSQKTIWTVPGHMQSVALGWWLTLVYWQWANRYFEGVAEVSERAAATHAVRQCETLCTLAEDLTVQAIRNQSNAEIGSKVNLIATQPFPNLALDMETYVSVWGVCEATYLQVQTDLSRILRTQFPKRFEPVLRELLNAAHPNLALFEHYQRNWMSSTSSSAQLDIVRRALEPVRILFEVGQRFWAPYLLGQVYTTCLEKKLTLEDLELGFDPWSITDQKARAKLQADPASVQGIVTFWSTNPAPRHTYQLQQEIMAAREQGKIRNMDHRPFPYAPWVSTWVAWTNVTIGGVTLRAGDLFALYAGLNARREFVNEIKHVGHFNLQIGNDRR